MKKITFRISEEIYEKLKKESLKNKTTISDLIRKKIMNNKKIIYKKNNNELKFLYEIQRIGNNLNQIAKKINSLHFKKEQLDIKVLIQILIEFNNNLKQIVEQIGK